MSDPRIESSLIRLADQDEPVLHVIVQGRHHWTHGPRLYDHIQQLTREEQPGGILLDFLAYEYEFGNDVGCLFLVGFDRKSGVHRPLAIVAKGRTRAALGTLAARTDLRSLDARFAESLEEALGWLRRAAPERPAQQRDEPDEAGASDGASQVVSVLSGRQRLGRSEESIPDWSRLLSLPPWMPLSDYGSPIVSISDHLHEVGTNAFLLTVLRPWPRIRLVHWAPSRGAAQRIFGRPEDDDGACGTPPAELIPAGAVPQYGSIFAVLRSSNVNGFRAESYRTAQDGKVIYRVIGTHRVAFYFRGHGDDNSEPPFGISVYPVTSR